MEQHLVAIRDGEVFYRLTDNDEQLDNLRGIYGERIIGCWRLSAPEYNEQLGQNLPDGLYPVCELTGSVGS